MKEKYDVKVYKKLVDKAKIAAESAYAPYSSFRVGSAVYTDTNNIYVGCNIENSAYPSGVCGEDVAIFKAISEGEKKIDVIAVACIDAKSDTAILVLTRSFGLSLRDRILTTRSLGCHYRGAF